MHRSLARPLLLAVSAAAWVTGAFAQQYPTRAVTMLVPYAAGGPTDTVARVVAQAMGKPLGQPILVENRPSAGGILAPEQVKNAKPDGYTILIHHVGMATTPALYRQLRFNPLTDFDYIGPMNDVLGGQVTFMCDQTTNTTSQIKSGKVKAYGVTSLKRVPSLPDIPTLDELGLKGFEVGIWPGLYAPKGTPKPAIDKLVAALQEALKDATVKQRFADLGAEAYPLDRATPEALHKFLKSEIDKWGPIIKKAGQYAD